MSIAGCSACGAWIDTDYHPEIYRDELNSVPVCDQCMYEFEVGEYASFDEFLAESGYAE